MIYRPTEPEVDEVLQNHKRHMERNALFLEHGIDRERGVGFIIDSAGPLRPPILDIGTGKGLTAIEVARRGVPVTSIDISEPELRMAFLNARAAKVDADILFHLADATMLPFDDDHFNLVTMVNVIHHAEEIPGIFNEVSRVLRPGGRFVVADFTDEGFEILAGIHEGEGRFHDRRNNMGMDDVAGMLPGYGLECRSRDSRFFEYVVTAEKL